MTIIDKIKDLLMMLVENMHKRRKAVLALSCLVVFVTTYLLILPAFTLEKTKAAEQGGIDVPGVTTTAEEVTGDEEVAEEAGGQTDGQDVQAETGKTEDAEAEVKDSDESKDSVEDNSDASDKEKADASAQTEDPLTFKDEHYTIAVDDKNSVLPENTEIKVKEIDKNEDAKKYEKHFDDALAAIQEEKDGENVSDLEFARFYDISLVSDGKEVTLGNGDKVNVNIEYDKELRKALGVENKDNIRIIHFAENKDTGKVEAEVLDNKEAKVEVNTDNKDQLKDASFEAESFSVYAVVYTVDFEYEGRTYSIQGGGTINLSDLFDILGIKENVKDVQAVEFSNTDLVTVNHKEGVSGEKEDWVLESQKPFDTQETLKVTLKNGDIITINVTDQQADITAQLKDATISGTGASSDGNTWKLEDPSGSYSIGLLFEESNMSDQFPKLTNGDSELQLTYKLPNGLIVDAQNGQASFTNNALGITIQFPWEVDNQGNIKLKLDNTQKTYTSGGNQYTAYEVFDAAVSANIKININGKWDGTTSKLHFSDKVEKDVEIGTPEPGTIKLYKDGWLDQNTKRLYYKFTVKADGGNVDTATITDTLTNATGIKIDPNSIKITKNDWPQDSSTYTKNVTDQGMVINFSNLTSGKEYYVEYYADVDYDQLDTDKDGKVAISPDNTVTDNKTESEKKIIENVTYTNVNKSVGKESDIYEEGGRSYRDLEWTIKVNDSKVADLKGTTLKDTIKSTTPPMEYIGELSVQRTGADGTTTTTNVPWTSLTNFERSKGWTYSFPNSEDKASYVFTYKTRVDVTDLKDKAKVTNEAEGKYGHEGKDGEVTPGEMAGVKKEFVSTQNGQSTWKITLTVPSYGLDRGIVEERVPVVYKDGKPLYDELVSYSVDESNLAPGEHAVKSDYNPPESGFMLNFYKDAGTDHPGFVATGKERKIEITVVTKNNEDWIDDTSLSSSHVNNASFNYMGVNASKEFTKKDIKKTVGVPDYPKTKEIAGKEYQILRYEVTLNGVDGSISIDDKMDIDGVIYETIPNSDYNGSLNLKYYSDWNWHNGEPLTVSQNGNGAKFTLPEDKIARNENDEFYSSYKFSYIVYVPMDKIQEKAAGSENLNASINNSVDWDGNKTTAEYKVKYDGLDKELLNEGSLDGNHRIAQYRIKVNPQGATVNGGEAYKLTDTFSDTLAVDYSSIQFSDPDAVLSYEVSGNTISIWIEDGKPLVITYNAKVLGEGQVKIENTAKTDFDEDKVESTRGYSGDAGGSGSFPIVHLMKVDGDNAKIRLDGVKFILHSRDEAVEAQLNSLQDQTKREFITDDKGAVDIVAHDTSDGYALYFNTEYYLLEDPTTVPEHYIPIGTSYSDGIAFIIDKDGNVDWSKHQYYNGYTMQVKNWKKKGNLEVSKTVSSSDSEDLTREYSFEIKLYKDQAKTQLADELTGTFGDVTITSGQGVFAVKHNNKVSITGIPDGIYYTVKERNVPTEMTVKYDGQIKESATGQIVYDETKAVAVENTRIQPGALKIKKIVQVNGNAPSNDAQKQLVDGDYVFTITHNNSVVKYVKVTITNGAAASYKVADTEAGLATATQNDGDVALISGLEEGDYTISEVGKNGLTLISAVRGDGNTDAISEDKAVTVHVSEGQTNPAEASAAYATFTNNCETVKARVKKIWRDENNKQGNRPVSLKVTLSNGTEKTLNASNGWEASVEDLPKYDPDGKLIEYTWTEEQIGNNYILLGNSTEEDETEGRITYVTTLTNGPDEHYDPTTDFSGNKIWNDDGTDRPSSITVVLYKGKGDNKTEVARKTITGTSTSNEWPYSFTNLPVFDAQGNVIHYSVKEELTGDYTGKYVSTQDDVTPISYERDEANDSVTIYTPNRELTISTGVNLGFIVIKHGNNFIIWTPRKATADEITAIKHMVHGAAPGNEDFSQIESATPVTAYGVPSDAIKKGNTQATIFMDGDAVKVDFGNKNWSSVAWGQLAYTYTPGVMNMVNTRKTTDFTFFKEWQTSGEAVAWPKDASDNNVNITVKVGRTYKDGNTDKEDTSFGLTYTIGGNSITDNAQIDPNETPAEGETLPKLKVSVSASTVPTYQFKLDNLAFADAQNNKYTYYVKETDVPEGFKLSFYQNGEVRLDPDKSIGKNGKIVNNSDDSVELPHTGGIGTVIFYVLGSILVIGGAIYFISRRRAMKQ